MDPVTTHHKHATPRSGTNNYRLHKYLPETGIEPGTLNSEGKHTTDWAN